VEVVVDVVVAVGLLARQGALGVVAHELGLVEDGADTAEEGPHAQLRDSFAVFIGHAQVEDLTAVVLVSVVAELAT